MSGRLLRFVRHNLLGLLAVLIACSSGAYAVSQIPNGSITGRQLNAKSVSHVVQLKVKGKCTGSTAIQVVKRSGKVSCATISPATSITAAAGSGLTVTPNPITGTGAVGTDFSTLQKRVSGTCSAAGANAVQSVAVDGTVSCGNLQSRVTGTCSVAGANAVQSVGAAGTVTCGNVQNRVTGSCTGNTAVQTVAADGSVTCSGTFAQSAQVHAAPVVQVASGTAATTLFDVNGAKVVLDCTNATTPKITVAPDGPSFVNVVATSHSSGYFASSVTAATTISSTTSTDRVDFNLGISDGRSVSGSAYTVAGASACQAQVSWIASSASASRPSGGSGGVARIP